MGVSEIKFYIDYDSAVKYKLDILEHSIRPTNVVSGAFFKPS